MVREMYKWDNTFSLHSPCFLYIPHLFSSFHMLSHIRHIFTTFRVFPLHSSCFPLNSICSVQDPQPGPQTCGS